MPNPIKFKKVVYGTPKEWSKQTIRYLVYYKKDVIGTIVFENSTMTYEYQDDKGLPLSYDELKAIGDKLSELTILHRTRLQ